MKARLALLFGMALLISAAVFPLAMAGADQPPADKTLAPASDAAVTPAVTEEQAPAADPYLSLSDVTSEAPEASSPTGATCLCVPGLNCCGDNPANPYRCGAGGGCHCPFFGPGECTS